MDARALLLKAGATALVLVTTLGSALYVTAHLKNPSAPLQPSVLNASQGSSAGLPGGMLTLSPSIRPSDAQPVTSTYAS